MFTRFSAPRGPRTAPVAGPLVSLMTHTAVVVVAVGGDVAGAAHDVARAAFSHARHAGESGERLHWVGLGDGAGGAAPTRPGARPPIAFVVPGRGAVREGRPGAGERRRARPGDALAMPLPPRREGLLKLRLTLPVATPPEVDATILVPGVVAAAPDLSAVASRPDDFVRRPAAELLDALMADVEVRATQDLRPLGRVDELPIALVTNPLPVYPTALARARVGGRVLVEFHIDSVGAIDLASLRVVESTNAQFEQAVRSSLPRMRFYPAQSGRHAVGVTVQQPFLFQVTARR